MTDDDIADGPAVTPKRGTRGPGCGCALVALPVVIVVGLVIGRLLGDEDTSAEVRAVLAEGTAGDQAWRVEAERDVEDDLCAFLHLDDEILTGACTTAPQQARLDGGNITIVFGRAPRDAVRVRVGLQDASGARIEPVEADAVDADPVEGRYYVVEVPGEVETTGTLEVIDP